ncbi:MAG: transcriptional regulator, partial [Terracidiphilus sp.]
MMQFPFLLLVALPGLSAQTPWTAIGPMGGDARALAAVPGHPQHLYLGTTNSWLYESTDGAANWHRLAKLDGTDDLILDHIVVDRANPGTIFAAAWRLEHTDGGLWVSRDGGRNWSEVAGLHGQSIRAFAQAPSDPAILFAGTLEGVFRSVDGGLTWSLISPPGSQEIHEVESLAIDPTDPGVIYAGTWHLPWKTSDGGKNWHNIKQGVIDDSDVFSIIIDPARPTFVFASACSGIYKSVNAGELFKRIQGIPSTARRTRVLKQDPSNPDIVYAGTTEGLYKTADGGKSFARLTGPEVIVNDIFVDPDHSNHVLMATDRGGVLTSDDAGASFTPSNEGFSGRKVEALLVDRNHPENLYAGVVNDKSFGGVYHSSDGGKSWQQIGGGLDGRDVFALAESPEGTILAGTNHGVFALTSDADADSQSWSPRGTIQNTQRKTAVETHYGKRTNVEKQVKERP